MYLKALYYTEIIANNIKVSSVKISRWVLCLSLCETIDIVYHFIYASYFGVKWNNSIYSHSITMHIICLPSTTTIKASNNFKAHTWNDEMETIWWWLKIMTKIQEELITPTSSSQIRIKYDWFLCTFFSTEGGGFY